jgi:protein dithiol oxidoreductase (disulfide-forming)
MKLLCSALVAAALAISASNTAHGAATWTEGVNYFVIQSAQKPIVPPGKVEVTEVFSYACPACNVFVPTMHKLKQGLPANVVLDYLPAAFNSAEDWPMFQLAYCTAQALGVEDKAHDAMYDAVWKGGDLSVTDGSGNLKNHMPTIEDAGKFYNQKTGVPVDKFLATSKSMTVDMCVRKDQELMRIYKIDRTPTIVVNGKYSLHVQSAGGADQLVELVDYLVAKESKSKQ